MVIGIVKSKPVKSRNRASHAKLPTDKQKASGLAPHDAAGLSDNR